MRLLLDTSVLIDALRFRRGRHELLARLVRSGHTLSTTAVNVAEVYAGMRSEEEQSTEALLTAMDCYDLTADTGRMAGSLKNKWAKKGRTIAIADAAVAAIAIERNCVLMTDNRKDFPMPELDLYPL
jgi:predicted nucleic acid-binding protein